MLVGTWRWAWWLLAVIGTAGSCSSQGPGRVDGARSDGQVDAAMLGDVMRVPDLPGERSSPVDDAVTTDGPASNLSAGLVQTTGGPVQGESGNGLVIFRGIPYAQSPVGALRWRAPSPATPWSTTRDATAFGAPCLQPPSPFLPDDLVPEGQSEDCLTLNIWTPARTAVDGLPVMVWIHGGGWTIGTGAYPVYEGSALARQGNVVLITLNYRLGPLGFVAHPSLSQEASYGTSGNYGMLDQLQALSWVRDNVAAFGGDPDNVTIFGESAGGGSVCYLLVSPLAQGLFHRAIVQSADCFGPLRRLRQDTERYDSGEQQGQTVEVNLGCDGTADPLGCMRAASFEQLLEAGSVASGGFDQGERFWPLIDGYFLVEEPSVTVGDGRQHRVPLIAGTTTDEASAFRPAFVLINNVNRYRLAVLALFGADRATVLEAYPVTDDALAKPTYERLLTDYLFICPTRRYARAFAQSVPVWLYSFAQVHPSGALLQRGAYHGSELFYVFGNLDPYNRYAAQLTADDRALSAATIGYWTRFAHGGDPNGGSATVWPGYDETTDRHLQLQWPVGASSGLLQDRCDLFDSLE